MARSRALITFNRDIIESQVNMIAPQHITLEQDHPQVLHCPLCGQCMLALDESCPDAALDVTPCPHLLFVWLDECFGHVSGRFLQACREAAGKVRALAEQHDWLEELPELEDEDDLGDYINTILFQEDEMTFLDYLALIGYGREVVCFELVEAGMGSGPVAFSSLFGFDCSTHEP